MSESFSGDSFEHNKNPESKEPDNRIEKLSEETPDIEDLDKRESLKKIASLFGIALGIGKLGETLKQFEKETAPKEKENGSELEQKDIPTNKEVVEILASLIAGREFEVTRSLDDKKGPYFREFRMKTEDGGMVEYEFMRKGRYPGGKKSLDTNISLTFYDQEGFPTGGEIVARYENGKWNLTS